MLHKFESLNDFNTVIKGSQPIVIDFTAKWCGPCRFIGPIFEKLAEQFPSVKFYKVDVDDQEDISAEVGVKAMPTFMLFHDGKKVHEIVGADQGHLNGLIQQAASLA